MKHCATCTCQSEVIADPDVLLTVLTVKDRFHREVYLATDDNWYVTHRGGRVSADAVRTLQQRGSIVRVYDDPRASAFHVGKTLDMKATLEARKGRKRAEGRLDIYTDGTSEIKPWS